MWSTLRIKSVADVNKWRHASAHKPWRYLSTHLTVTHSVCDTQPAVYPHMEHCLASWSMGFDVFYPSTPFPAHTAPFAAYEPHGNPACAWLRQSVPPGCLYTHLSWHQAVVHFYFLLGWLHAHAPMHTDAWQLASPQGAVPASTGPATATAILTVMLQMQQFILLTPGKALMLVPAVFQLLFLMHKSLSRCHQQPPSEMGECLVIVRVHDQCTVRASTCLVPGTFRLTGIGRARTCLPTVTLSLSGWHHPYSNGCRVVRFPAVHASWHSCCAECAHKSCRQEYPLAYLMRRWRVLS